MTAIKQIENALKAGPTEGDWSVPHYSRDDVDCDCTSVLSESYCGAIATIHFNDGKPISEGGGDDPIPSEAKANGLLIAACNPAAMREVLAHIAAQDAEIARLREVEQQRNDLLAAFGDLSFECFGVIGHCERPTVATYNRTFEVLQKVRSAIATTTPKG